MAVRMGMVMILSVRMGMAVIMTGAMMMVMMPVSATAVVGLPELFLAPGPSKGYNTFRIAASTSSTHKFARLKSYNCKIVSSSNKAG